MKRFFSLALCALLLALTAPAHAENKMYTYADKGELTFGMLSRVSTNGRWAVGTDDSYQTGSFIIDTQAPESLIPVSGGELYDITDQCLAVGSWYKNIGTVAEPINEYHAAIYRSGVWTRLPEPRELYGQSYARCVTPDGKYIGGMAFCYASDSDTGGKAYPCLWTLDEATGTYSLTCYNNLTLPSNMGFYINDITDDGTVMAGTLCTDAGGTVPALVQNGELVVWNKMEWKPWSIEINGKTYTVEMGFVDDVIDGADSGWFQGGFNYICGNYAFGDRTIASNVDAQKGSGTLTHCRCVYNLLTGEFFDEPSSTSFTCGIDPGDTFFTTAATGESPVAYYLKDGAGRSVNKNFGLPNDLPISCVYSADAGFRVLTCSAAWFNEAIGEYCETPVLVILDGESGGETPMDPDAPVECPFSVVPLCSQPVSSVSGVITLTFPTVSNIFMSRRKIYLYDGEGNPIMADDGETQVSYTLSMGDAPNVLKFTVVEPLDVQGQYRFVIPEGSLLDDDTAKPLPEIQFTYTVKPDATGNGTWSISPSLDKPVPQLKGTYTVTLNQYENVQWNSLSPCNVYIYHKDTGTSGRPYKYYRATTSGNTITFTVSPALTEAGDYILSIEGFLNVVNDTEHDIPALNIPFTLTGSDPDPDTPESHKLPLDQSYILSPDNSQPLAELSGKIYITFPGIPSFEDVGGFPTITEPDGTQHGVFADGTIVRIKQEDSYDGSAYKKNAGYIDLDAAGLKFTQNGKYVFSIPKNVFHVNSDIYEKAYVDPFEFTYTIDQQALVPKTVLLEEDFNGDYSVNFPYSYDGDSQLPASNIQAWFLSAEHGYFMPWWKLRESASDPDIFMGSHSYYEEPGQSDDWFVSRAVEIPTTGFQLDFDAQSVVVRSGDRLSDLCVYITEEMVTDEWRPTEPAAVFRQVPAGKQPDVTTNEWTRYTLSLDPWAGKTIHISFANQNTDKDLLCIDNVKVYRSDAIQLAVETLPQYTADEQVTINATVKASSAPIGDYTITFSDGTRTQEQQGTPLEAGEEQAFQATFDLTSGQQADFTVTVTPADDYPISQTFSVTRLAFATTRRVLLEETTGLWCGNCPVGTYNIESLCEDASFGHLFCPVSIHTTGTGSDLMAMDEYADFLGMSNVAPMVRLDRQATALGFSSAYDTDYNPSEPKSFAYHAIQQQATPALFDLSVDCEPVVEQGDTTAFRVVATVRPALNLPQGQYRVGFILTENNVGLDQNPYWLQTNYFAGYPFASKLGGWTELPERVGNLRYHFVARSLPYPTGIRNSFTQPLAAGEEYKVETTIEIPNTLQTDSRGNVTAPAIRPYQCELTAYITDIDDLTIANSARVSVTEQAQQLHTVSDLITSIAATAAPAPATGRTYDLQGRPVTHPLRGIYLRDGKKVVK